MGLLCSSFVLEPISLYNHIIRKTSYILFSNFKLGNRDRNWSQVTFLDTETLANQFKMKAELPMWSTILLLYSRLTSAIFIVIRFIQWPSKFNYIQFTSATSCQRKKFWIRKADRICEKHFSWQNHTQNVVEKLFQDFFPKDQNWTYHWINSLKILLYIKQNEAWN